MRCRKLPPIDRKPCLWWRGIKVVEDEDAKEAIGYACNSKLLASLNQELRIAEVCMRHKFDYALRKQKYRMYRRGKGRCKLCGVKVVKEMV